METFEVQSKPRNVDLDSGFDPDEKLDHDDGFGEKTIGPFGSLVLLFNNLSGPGVIGLPLLFQEAGWFVPCLTLVWISITTWLSGSMVCEAMRYYEGNKGYRSRIEFSTLCKFYFGKYFYWFTQLVFILSLQSVNVSGIIETAQVMDYLIMAIFHKTGGLEFFPSFGWAWSGATVPPFSDGTYVLTLGFVATVILIIPLGYFNLDDNMIVQKAAFTIGLTIFAQWIINFFLRIHNPLYYNPIPVFGHKMARVFGTIMFNYAMVVTIPSWCNEKTHGTNINRVLMGAITAGTGLFFLIGFFGAMTYKIPDTGDLLEAFAQDEAKNWLTSASIYLFPLSVVATSIPIYSIIVRYNLLENKICNKPVANFIAVILPWIVVIPFYTGDGLTELINWSTLISNGIVNFIIPFFLFIKARRRKMALPKEDRQDLDEPLPKELKDPDTVFCGRVIGEGALPAPPHFTFGDCFDDFSVTPLIISATFVACLSFSFIGILIINTLDKIGIP